MKPPQGLEKGLDFKKQFLANASKNQDYQIIFIFVCIAADEIKSILSFEMLFHDFCVSKHKQYQFENISQTVILNFFVCLTLSLRTTPFGGFSDYFLVFRRNAHVHQIQHKCYLKAVTIAAQQTSTAKLVAFFTIFQKIVRVLRVTETKLPSKYASLVDLFALKSRKGSKIEERTLFWDSSWSLHLSLNPQPPNDAILAVSQTFFVLAFFWPLFLLFRRKDQIHQILHKISRKSSHHFAI